MVDVDFKHRLGLVLERRILISKSLRLDNSLHIGSESVRSRHQRRHRFGETLRHGDLAHAILQLRLQPLGQIFPLLFHLLLLLSQYHVNSNRNNSLLKTNLVFVVFLLLSRQLQAFTSNIGQLVLAVKLGQLSEHVLVDGVHQKQHLQTALLKLLQKRADGEKG